jgi:hypothetical protein
MSLEDTPETKHPNIITLNIGGTKFTTALSTLTSHKDTFFDALLSGKFPLTKEPDGSIFIDRSPTYFGTILEYLRDGPKWTLDTEKFDKKDLQKLLRETEFYQLTQLSKLINEQLKLHKTVTVIIEYTHSSMIPLFSPILNELFIALKLNNFKKVKRLRTDTDYQHHETYISHKQTESWATSKYNKNVNDSHYHYNIGQSSYKITIL